MVLLGRGDQRRVEVDADDAVAERGEAAADAAGTAAGVEAGGQLAVALVRGADELTVTVTF